VWEGVDLLLRAVVRTNLTDVREDSREVCRSFSLVAYPNPFSGTLFLRVDGLEVGVDALEVYDLLGRRVTSVLPRTRGSVLIWSGKDARGRPVPSGVYILKARRGRDVAVARVLKY